MESKFLDRIPWERQYYGDTILSQFPFKPRKCKMCKMCGTSYPDETRQIPLHIMHLNIVHIITELTDHPERGFLVQKFLINELKSKAKCRTCKEVILYNKYGLYLLKNHVEIYHGNSSDIYKAIAMTKSGLDTLDKYIIIGNEATCPKCELKMDMTDLNIHIVEKVEVLLEHYFSHSLTGHIQQKFKKNALQKFKIEKIKKIDKYDRLLKKQTKYLKKEDELLRRTASILNKKIITKRGRTVLNEPGPSTSSSTVDYKSDQNRVKYHKTVLRLPTKRRKSSTLDKIQLEREKNKRQFYE